MFLHFFFRTLKTFAPHVHSKVSDLVSSAPPQEMTTCFADNKRSARAQNVSRPTLGKWPTVRYSAQCLHQSLTCSFAPSATIWNLDAFRRIGSEHISFIWMPFHELGPGLCIYVASIDVSFASQQALHLRLFCTRTWSPGGDHLF